jgi:hypothetical protein
LPKNTEIEQVSKQEIFEGLRRATSRCKTKALYEKSEHSFKILLLISPDKLKDASPWAKRFLDGLAEIMQA